MSEINHAIARVVKKFRLAAAISQEELAHAADIHRTYISQIERGLKSPTLHVLLRIANALNVRISDIAIAIEVELYGVQSK